MGTYNVRRCGWANSHDLLAQLKTSNSEVLALQECQFLGIGRCSEHGFTLSLSDDGKAGVLYKRVWRASIRECIKGTRYVIIVFQSLIVASLYLPHAPKRGDHNILFTQTLQSFRKDLDALRVRFPKEGWDLLVGTDANVELVPDTIFGDVPLTGSAVQGERVEEGENAGGGRRGGFQQDRRRMQQHMRDELCDCMWHYGLVFSQHFWDSSYDLEG